MSARVLVVDDVLPNVKLLAAKLTREYFDVITAFNGPEALERIKKEAPDIILLDVMMPGMDGFEVCARIRSDPTTMHIPIVMITALSDAADRVRGLEAGADDFLTKPVNDIALFARVRSLVRLKMMMDEWRLRESTSGQFGILDQPMTVKNETAANARVLVVEDSPIDLEKIAETLRRDTDSVVAADTSAKALDLGMSEDFELIIVSLTLLHEDGLRLCSQLRSHERTRQAPILLIADEGDLSRVAKGLELGANDYLLKPIDRNELAGARPYAGTPQALSRKAPPQLRAEPVDGSDRQPDRGLQPPLCQRSPAAPSGAELGEPEAGRDPDVRHRPLQDRQRYLWPWRGRRGPAGGREPDEPQSPQLRSGGALWR